jgi:pre-mRNA-splicing factor ATP-dependent RNA helicase DHX16
VAQGLAQAAVHGVLNKHEVLDPAKPTTAAGTPILEIAKQFYDSDDLVPPPYDPHPTPGKVNAIMTMDGVKPKKIRELCAKWLPSGPLTNADIDAAVEDLSWLATLLLFCTSKRGHKHRLDFFLMHILNATTFIPSLLQNIPNMENKRQFIQSYLSFELLYAIFRGRPKIDCEVIIQYRLTPRSKPEDTNATDAIAPTETDPWLGIIQEVVHAKDAHTVKAVRALYIFARRYGTKQAGDIPGAEMFPGGDKLDGSLFVRGARVVLDVMGWVTLGDKEGEWDFSSLGYNEAWEDSPDTQSA